MSGPIVDQCARCGASILSRIPLCDRCRPPKLRAEQVELLADLVERPDDLLGQPQDWIPTTTIHAWFGGPANTLRIRLHRLASRGLVECRREPRPHPNQWRATSAAASLFASAGGPPPATHDRGCAAGRGPLTFGEYLSICLRSARMTQRALSEAIGVRPATVCGWCRDTHAPQPHNIAAIAYSLPTFDRRAGSRLVRVPRVA
jgi:hypothetical protein